MKHSVAAAGLLTCLMLPSLVLAATPKVTSVFKDPNAQTPDWSQPLRAPFVDIFHLLPDNRLLIGALDWDGSNRQFKQGELKLLSVADGATLWAAKREPILGASHSLIGMQQGTVVVQAVTPMETKLFGYGLADGNARWQFTIHGTALSTPIEDTATLVISATDHVTALDVASGKPAWTRPVELRARSTVAGIVTTPDTVCILGRNIACVDRAAGTERWNKPDPDTSALGRAFLTGSKLITGTDTSVAAWNIANGAQLWRVSAPVQGLVDVVTDDTTLYAAWLDSTDLVVKLQAIAAADGKMKWISEAVPIPRSTLMIAGETGYFSSASMLLALNLRTGKVFARTLLPLLLIDTDRKPDDILVQKDTVLVSNENGSATFAAPDLKLLKVAGMGGWGTRAQAERNLKDEIRVLGDQPWGAVGPTPLQSGQGSALANAAQTRIQMAYAHSRPVLESSRTSHAQKAAAHGYVAQEINGAISMQRQAIRMEQMQAAANVANSALGLLQAIQVVKRRNYIEGKLALFGYYVKAGDLRNEATPPGYALVGGDNSIRVFDAARNSIAEIHHSSERSYGWTHIALLSEDRSHLIGAHVGQSPSERTTQINSDTTRADLNIESYPLAKAVWKDAAPPSADDALAADIRSGKITSLQEQHGVCYMATLKPLAMRSKELIFAAIAGRNVALLKEMHAHGAFSLARPMWDFDAVAVARDLMDRELTATFEAAALHQAVTFELLQAVRLGDPGKAKAALAAGADPDGFAPLSATRTCNTPPLSYASSKELRTLLLESGAHVNIINDKGQTPLDLVLANKDHDKSLARFLSANGGKPAAELQR